MDLSSLTSISIGPVSNVYIVENTSFPNRMRTIGAGNNLLISNSHPPLMMLSKKFSFIRIEDGALHVGGATPTGKIVSFCKKHNIAGFEFLSQLPGTLGGAVFMNAGLKEHETFNNLLTVTTEHGVVAKNMIEHGYRFSRVEGLIFEASFKLKRGFSIELLELFKKMRSNQPRAASAGSCFKNPKDDYAGRLIEAVGLKGKRIGGMVFHEKHANFLANLGGGTFNEAMSLIKLAQKRVFEEFNIELETEITIISI